MPAKTAEERGRPKKAMSLLSIDVTYDGWEQESANKPRFYVRGVSWAKQACGTGDVSDFRQFALPAVEAILSETKWPEQVLAKVQNKKIYKTGWAEPPAYNQLLRACNNRKPVFFHKAAQIVVMFEQALRDPSFNRNKIDPLEVYQNMYIEPACFNLDRFNKALLADLRAKSADFDRRVLQHIGQTEAKLLDELADGFTVTQKTATKLKEFITKQCDGFEVGDVRHTPGKRRLGQNKASDLEFVTH